MTVSSACFCFPHSHHTAKSAYNTITLPSAGAAAARPGPVLGYGWAGAFWEGPAAELMPSAFTAHNACKS